MKPTDAASKRLLTPRRSSLENILKQAPVVTVCDHIAGNFHDVVGIARVPSVEGEGCGVTIPGCFLDELLVENSIRPGQHGYLDAQFFVQHFPGAAKLNVNKLV